MKLLRLLARLLRQHGDGGRGFEPEAGVRVPRRSPPSGRGAAIAVMEPEPDGFVDAVGKARSHSRHNL